MSKPLSQAEQADAYRIRMLIGPVRGRDDLVIESFARLIEQGDLSFDEETQILSFVDWDSSPPRKYPFLHIQKDGSFRRAFKLPGPDLSE